MRRPRSRSLDDFDAVDVLIDEGEAADAVHDVLHTLALEAMALRAASPGDPRTELGAERTWGADDPEAPPDEPDAARRGRRRRIGRWTTVGVLLLALNLTTTVVDARRAAARLATLTATPAVLASVPSPPAEVWRMTGRVVSDQADLLLVADASTRSLRAVDPATGEVTWTASSSAGDAAAAGHCFAADEGLRPGRVPLADDGGPPGLLACVAETPGTPGPEGGATGGVRVVVVDTTTGVTRHTLTAEGTLLTAEPVGRDLLTALALPDGRFRAARWDLTSGVPRWDHVGPASIDGPATPDAVERRQDSLTVGATALDLATGEELDAEEARREPLRYEEHVLPGGARATWSWRPSGDSGRGRVAGTDLARAYTLPGPPLRPPITDGSDARTLVVTTARGDRLRGLDLGTGRLRWSEPYRGASPARSTALVNGVMLLDDGATVMAMDVGSGARLWTALVDGAVTAGSVLTDGEVVLLPVRVGDGALHLVARSIDDGAAVWHTKAPAGTVSLAVVDHHLVASTEHAVIGLG